MQDFLPKTPKPRLIQPLASQPIQESGKNLAMRMGERLHLEIHSTGERLWGELVGFKQGAFLLVWLPALMRHRQALINDNMVTVRGMNCDFQLCGFRAAVSKTMINPHPLLFLHFPDVFEKLHLRRHDRVECFLPALMLMGGQEYKAVIVNLSPGGARIVLNSPNHESPLELFEDQEVFLMFKTVEHGLEICAKAYVRSICNNEGKITLGTEFLDLIGDSKAVINEYVANIKEYAALK